MVLGNFVVLIVVKIVAGPSIFKSKSCALIGRLFEHTSFENWLADERRWTQIRTPKSSDQVSISFG